MPARPHLRLLRHQALQWLPPACQLEGRTSGPRSGTDSRGAGGMIVGSNVSGVPPKTRESLSRTSGMVRARTKIAELGMIELGIPRLEHASVVSWLIRVSCQSVLGPRLQLSP